MMSKNNSAFTLTELLIALLILSITAGAFTLTPDIGRNKPEREAERISARLHAMIREAGKRHMNFKMTVGNNGGEIRFEWQNIYGNMITNRDEPYIPGKGFKLSLTAPNNQLIYNAGTNDFSRQGGHITVERDDGEKYFVIIAKMGGRIRTSPALTLNEDD